MTAKKSAEVKEAFRLVSEENKTVAEACKIAKIHFSALYRHKPYIEWRKSQKGSKP